MSLISLMITPSCRVFAREAPSCCEAAMPFRLRRGGSCHLPFLCSRCMTVAIFTPGTASEGRKAPTLFLRQRSLVLALAILAVFPSATSDTTVSLPLYFPLLTHPPPPPPLPPSLPPHSRQLYYEKYTVSIECPSDIFDLLASFRTVFNQPP